MSQGYTTDSNTATDHCTAVRSAHPQRVVPTASTNHKPESVLTYPRGEFEDNYS